jgi:hypothetical protein
LNTAIAQLFSPDPPARGSRHPWDRWFAAGRFTARRGEDFAGRTDTFILQVRQQAGRRGVGVKVRVSGDGSEVRVEVRERRA